jgi:hypothetical protein
VSIAAVICRLTAVVDIEFLHAVLTLLATDKRWLTVDVDVNSKHFSFCSTASRAFVTSLQALLNYSSPRTLKCMTSKDLLVRK